jgi:hypothetical protein
MPTSHDPPLLNAFGRYPSGESQVRSVTIPKYVVERSNINFHPAPEN